MSVCSLFQLLQAGSTARWFSLAQQVDLSDFNSEIWRANLQQMCFQSDHIFHGFHNQSAAFTYREAGGMREAAKEISVDFAVALLKEEQKKLLLLLIIYYFSLLRLDLARV